MPLSQNGANAERPAERRLYQLVADQLRALIKHGDFEAGDRLPSERELAQQLGVSRPSLREALIALEIEGAVEIRMGSGIYVLTIDEKRAILDHLPMRKYLAFEAISPLRTLDDFRDDCKTHFGAKDNRETTLK